MKKNAHFRCIEPLDFKPSNVRILVNMWPHCSIHKYYAKIENQSTIYKYNSGCLKKQNAPYCVVPFKTFVEDVKNWIEAIFEDSATGDLSTLQFARTLADELLRDPLAITSKIDLKQIYSSGFALTSGYIFFLLMVFHVYYYLSWLR